MFLVVVLFVQVNLVLFLACLLNFFFIVAYYSVKEEMKDLFLFVL
jgi:hypothetical protein